MQNIQSVSCHIKKITCIIFCREGGDGGCINNKYGLFCHLSVLPHFGGWILAYDMALQSNLIHFGYSLKCETIFVISLFYC